MIGPDATVTLDFALNRMAGMIENMVVYSDRMLANLESLGGLHNSQRILLALTQAGASREDAYRLVQKNAMESWHQGRPLQTLAVEDADIRALLSEDEVNALFDLDYHTKHVETIFKRVFG